jgi:predicted nucleic-acid-binding protein
MIFVDTNILVRIITGDDRILAQKALEMIDTFGKDDMYVDETVLSELCFVLEFQDYKMKRLDIYNAIMDVLDSPQFTNSVNTYSALEIYKNNSKLDFTDCLILVKSKKSVLTFDKDILKFNDM